MNAIEPVDKIGAEIVLVICRTFRCLPQQVTRATQASDIDGWDSLSHSVLLVAIERRFAVTLNYADVYDAADVGTLTDYVSSLLLARRPAEV